MCQKYASSVKFMANTLFFPFHRNENGKTYIEHCHHIRIHICHHSSERFGHARTLGLKAQCMKTGFTCIFSITTLANCYGKKSTVLQKGK